MFGSPLLRVVSHRILAGLLVLATGGGGGAVLGSVDLNDQPATAEQARQVIAAAEPPKADIGALVVQESPQPELPAAPAAPAAPVVQKRVVKVQAPKPAAVTGTLGSPTLAGPPGATMPANCDRLNDRMIQWLRRLVAETRDANPGTESIASRLDSQLLSGLGQNMCAEQAQAYFTAMCADPVVRDFMDKMVKELPFFVRPLVGDPCRHDLVKAAQKYM